ncbi:MAG TPA: hypothetical protein VF655_13545 [Allosphingosinicella sp.]|jgi:hypothetical protein
MRGTALVVFALGLCLASSPLHAKSRSKASAAHAPTAAGHNPALSGIGRFRAQPVPPMASSRLPLRVYNDTIIREDGTLAERRAIVGSMPVVGSVEAELGLFSVTGAKMKERQLSEADPVADVQPRRSKVAAVGLRMRF